MAKTTRLAIKNGTLIDGSGGDPVPNRLLVVEGNRITLVGETDGSMRLEGFVKITGWPGREVADRLTRWQKSHTAATAFRRLSSSMLCGSTCVSP